jgi:hypothetical protein
MHKQLTKKELRELQQQTLLNILSVGKIIFTHYKNKQLKQRGKKQCKLHTT